MVLHMTKLHIFGGPNRFMIVYKIINKINGKIYIGQTKYSISTRFSQHVHYANKRKYTSVLLEAIRKYGRENFEINILVRCDTMEEMNHREAYYIALFDSISPNGYNLDSGGKNKKMHESTKIKISVAKTGKRLAPFSEEHRANLSKANRGRGKGRKLDENVKKKISEANSGSNNYMFGKRHSEECKQRMSENKRGKYLGNKNPFFGKKHSEEIKRMLSEKAKNKIPIVCEQNGITYSSIKEACLKLDLKKDSVRDVVNGKRSNINGFTFKRI